MSIHLFIVISNVIVPGFGPIVHWKVVCFWVLPGAPLVCPELHLGPDFVNYSSGISIVSSLFLRAFTGLSRATILRVAPISFPWSKCVSLISLSGVPSC